MRILSLMKLKTRGYNFTLNLILTKNPGTDVFNILNLESAKNDRL